MALISVPFASPSHAVDMCENCNGGESLTANLDAENATKGVSLENTLVANDEENYTPTIDEILSPEYVQHDGFKWFFLRVSHNRAEKFYNELKDRQNGFLLWMPCQKVVSYDGGRKFEKLTPIFKSNIFVYTTKEIARSLTSSNKETGYDYVSFAYDHTTGRRGEAITVYFQEMLSFIRAEHIHHPWAHVVSEEQIHFRPGGLVRVTDGPFKGVVGRVARVYGQTRVVITIQGIMNYATAYVSPKFMVPFEQEAEQ